MLQGLFRDMQVFVTSFINQYKKIEPKLLNVESQIDVDLTILGFQTEWELRNIYTRSVMQVQNQKIVLDMY